MSMCLFSNTNKFDLYLKVRNKNDDAMFPIYKHEDDNMCLNDEDYLGLIITFIKDSKDIKLVLKKRNIFLEIEIEKEDLITWFKKVKKNSVKIKDFLLEISDRVKLKKKRVLGYDDIRVYDNILRKDIIFNLKKDYFYVTVELFVRLEEGIGTFNSKGFLVRGIIKIRDNLELEKYKELKRIMKSRNNFDDVEPEKKDDEGKYEEINVKLKGKDEKGKKFKINIYLENVNLDKESILSSLNQYLQMFSRSI